MKKLLLTLVAASAAFGAAFAAETQKTAAAPEPAVKPQPRPVDQWTPFQLGLFPGFPSATKTSNVRGVKTGWPMVDGYGRVYGLEASWLYSGTDYIDGVQGSFVYSQCKELNGLQADLCGSLCTDTFNGVETALGFCYCQNAFRGVQSALAYCQSGDFVGLQASALNISGNVLGFQASAFCNVTDDVTGFQASVIVNASRKLTGFQTAIVNTVKESTGWQFGLINVSKKGGFQIGLINYIEDARFKWLPLVNCAL